MRKIVLLIWLSLCGADAIAQRKLLERGFGSAIASSQNNHMVGLHRNYPIGTRLLVRNTANDASVVVKVIGTMPNTAENGKLVIKLSQAACRALNASGKKFSVELFSAPAEQEIDHTAPAPKEKEKEKEREKEPEGNDKEVSHRVVAGETLYSIAKKFGVKVEDIMTWNKLENSTLFKGQVLKIIKRF